MISRRQRTLWRAVSAAEFAVLEVQQAGEQARELDDLCRRLRLTVADTEHHFAPPRRSPLPGHGPGHPPPGFSHLIIAAGMIQDAAASVVTSLPDSAEQSEPDDGSRAENIRRHCEAIAARIDKAAGVSVGLRKSPETAMPSSAAS